VEIQKERQPIVAPSASTSSATCTKLERVCTNYVVPTTLHPQLCYHILHICASCFCI